MLPIFEYCCLNWFCRPCHSTLIGHKDSYHNLASPTNVRQNLWALKPSWNWFVFIQSFILSKRASTSPDFPENSGLKCYQFICGICCTCMGWCRAWGAEGAGICGACNPASAIFYLFYVIMLHYVIFYSAILMCL